MSEFWDKINADYVARGGEIRPEVWNPAARPAEPKRKGHGKGQTPGVPQPWDHGPVRLLTPAQEQEIRRRYEEDLEGFPEIARATGYSKTMVRNAVIRAGGTIRSKSEATRIAIAKRQTGRMNT